MFNNWSAALPGYTQATGYSLGGCIGSRHI